MTHVNGDYKELIKKENEKLKMTTSKKTTKKGISENELMKDYRAILIQRATITKRDWGGHCFEYCDKEIASSYKVQDLSQEQAKTICEIIKIPLTENDSGGIPIENLCPCGCGEMLRKGARFRQGHDTKLKYRLIREYKKTKSKTILKELRSWGWEKYLG